MKIGKLVLVCTALSLAVSLNATDTNKKLESYNKAVKLLEKKTSRALHNCKLDTECVNSEYENFVQKRDKLVKSKLHVRPKHLKRIAKKTLKKESSCIKSTPEEARGCFEKSDEEMNTAVASLT